MELWIAVLAAFAVICGAFILTHLRPLTLPETAALAGKWRNRAIAIYFKFAAGETHVDKDFKRRLNPNGTFYSVEEHLAEFPRLAAALLKWKKHEWIIVAFEREHSIRRLWVNKGANSRSVSLALPILHVLDLAVTERFTSVLVFHNHPNSNPSRITCTRPSDVDIRSACTWNSEFMAHGINLLEFICERGKAYPYFASYGDAFMPHQRFVEEIKRVNGTSRWNNLWLHSERIFS